MFLRGFVCEAESIRDGAPVPDLVPASCESSASAAAAEMLWSTLSTPLSSDFEFVRVEEDLVLLEGLIP